MEPMSVFDWLLANEVKRQVDAMSDFDRQRSADSVKEADMRHIHAWYGPGMADLRAVAESEGEETGVTEKWLRKRRGDLVIAGATAAAVDALTMPQFFLALTGRLQLGMPIAEAVPKPTGSGARLAGKKPPKLTRPGREVQKAIEMIQKGTYKDRQIIEVSKIKSAAALAAIKSKLKLGKYDLSWQTS